MAVIVASASAANAEPVSFEREIAPILETNCSSCHLTGEETGRLALYPGKAYASLVKVQSSESSLLRVAPGSPDLSYLIAKLSGRQLDVGGRGARMPFGQSPLSASDIEKIKKWISAGAPNN
jgi:hypothetical protein